MVAGSQLFFGLINNLSIFIALIAVYSFLLKRLNDRSAFIRQMVLGFVFGGFAIACMNIKIQVFDGVLVDQRNAIVVLSGIFAGPLSAVISGTMAAAYRLSLGGVGIFGGSTGIALAAIAGLILNKFRVFSGSIPKAAAGSLFAVILVLPGFLPIKNLETGWSLLKQMAIPYGSAIFFGIFFVGLLLKNEENRFRTQLALTDSERRYRELFSRLIDINYHTDLNGVFTVISPSCQSILGYTEQELLNTRVERLFKDRAQHERFVAILVEKGVIDNFEAEVVRADGTVIWISFNARPIWNGDTVIGSEGMMREITQLKESEAKKQELEDNLQQSQKMEAIGTLASGIAHDFNNILSVIFAYTQLAKKKISDQPKLDKIRDYLDKIQSAGFRAEAMVKQILTFSRKLEFEPKPIDLKPLLKETIKFLHASLPSTITIKKSIGSDLWMVLGDYTQIHQVILNLSTNGFHALQEKSGEIEIALQNFEIERSSIENNYLTPGKYVLLSVRDNGMGMSVETLKRVFDPFFTTKDKGKGTGLGLSVVHGIVQKHHGGIYIYSKPGAGTKVNVYFPISDSEAMAPEPVPKTNLPRGVETILLVDDEVDIADSYSEILGLYGYNVQVEINGEKAIEAFSQQPFSFDLVITDFSMPGITGLELTEKLLKMRSDIPVILISGLGETISHEEMEKVGVSMLLPKPIELSHLVMTVRDVIDNGKTMT